MSRVSSLMQVLILITLLQVSVSLGIFQGLKTYESEDFSLTNIDKSGTILEPILEPQQNNYKADLHWVETNITIDKKGNGKVLLVVNCTATTGHQGIFIKRLNDDPKFLLTESYAYSNAKKLAINITYNRAFFSHLIFLANSSQVAAGQNILYSIAYETNFYLNGQMSRYQVNTTQTAVNLIRPIWEDALEYQRMRIQLPIEVTNATITPDFLNQISFVLGQDVMLFYNVSFFGLKNTGNKFMLNILFSKENLPENAAFQTTFYLAISYFSFPKVFNWFVITFVSLTTLIALGLFLVLITFKKDSKNEVEEFKKTLYNTLKNQEKT